MLLVSIVRGIVERNDELMTKNYEFYTQRTRYEVTEKSVGDPIRENTVRDWGYFFSVARNNHATKRFAKILVSCKLENVGDKHVFIQGVRKF